MKTVHLPAFSQSPLPPPFLQGSSSQELVLRSGQVSAGCENYRESSLELPSPQLRQQQFSKAERGVRIPSWTLENNICIFKLKFKMGTQQSFNYHSAGGLAPVCQDADYLCRIKHRNKVCLQCYLCFTIQRNHSLLVPRIFTSVLLVVLFT